MDSCSSVGTRNAHFAAHSAIFAHLRTFYLTLPSNGGRLWADYSALLQLFVEFFHSTMPRADTDSLHRSNFVREVVSLFLNFLRYFVPRSARNFKYADERQQCHTRETLLLCKDCILHAISGAYSRSHGHSIPVRLFGTVS